MAFLLSRARVIAGFLASLCVACGGSSHDTRVIEVPPPDAGQSDAELVDSGVVAEDPTDANIDDHEVPDAPDATEVCVKTPGVASGNLELVTIGLGCRAADGDSIYPALSVDARYVFYQSDADDLVSADFNGVDDIFVFDRLTRTLERLSVTASGGATIGYSFGPVASEEGQEVAFTSMSPNLVSSPAPDGIRMYRRNRATHTTTLIHATYACAHFPKISGDGNLVVWETSPNCSGSFKPEDSFSAFIHFLDTNSVEPLGEADGSDNYRPVVSRNGRWVAWGTRPPLTRGQLTSEMKLLDRLSGSVQTVPIGRSFNFPVIALSNDAEVIAYSSNGDLFRYDRLTNTDTHISQNALGEVANDVGFEIALSGDGRSAVFSSKASNLVEGDTNGVRDIFLFRIDSPTLRRLSVTPDGSEADDESQHPEISADGMVVAFASKARNLLPAATSGDWQIYTVTLDP